MALMDGFSDEQWKKAREIIEEGNFENTAYALVGVSKSAWLEWKREARKIQDELDSGARSPDSLDAGERRLVDFLAMTVAAWHEAKRRHVANIKSAGANPDHWQASAWFLERTDNLHFGRKDSLNVKGSMVHASLGLTPAEEAEVKAFFMAEFPGLLGRPEEDVGAV
jgi:hypothetical protein